MAEDTSVLAVELQHNYIVKEWHTQKPSVSHGEAVKGTKGTLTTQLKTVFATAFLPEGYPESVTQDYLGFQCWDTIQALSSYVRGMLSGQAILRGVGVGKKAATPLGAVFQFFVRDMAGMVGGILFAYSQGSSFDSCAKQWRIFADVINDIGMTVELASPMFPSLFLAMACFGSIARSMTGVAGGATRAALTQHFARTGNAADISAKEQSQETVTTMIGMLLGMAITSISADSVTMAWTIFSLLTLLHVWANIRALRCLVLTSLNRPRIDVLLHSFLLQDKVDTPKGVAVTESLVPPPLLAFLGHLHLRVPSAVVLGAPLSQLIGDTGITGLQRRLDASGQQRYLVGHSEDSVLLVMHSDASSYDTLRGYVHACYLEHALSEAVTYQLVRSAEQQAARWMNSHYPRFEDKLRAAGWNLDKICLPRSTRTARWEVKAADKRE